MADFSGMIKAIKDWAVSRFLTEIPVGSTTNVGGVKADGTTTTIDSDGTIHASGGGGGTGTTDYNALENKPSIGDVTLSGNKTLSELGIQPKGEYLTSETDPTVPSWAKEPSKPTYTASEVGADAAGSASTALANAKDYVDQAISNLVGGAPETLNTLKEISDALAESEKAVAAIDSAIGNKLGKTGDSKDNTVTFTQASTRENIASSETHSTLFGKIAKWFADLKTVAFSGSYNDLSDKPSIPTVNNAKLTIQKNGTTVKTFTANSSTNVTANITVPTKTSELTNDSGFLKSATVLDSYEEIMANTASGKFAGALGVKEGLNMLNDSLDEQPSFVYDENGQITGYTTKIGGADTVFPFKGKKKYLIKDGIIQEGYSFNKSYTQGNGYVRIYGGASNDTRFFETTIDVTTNNTFKVKLSSTSAPGQYAYVGSRGTGNGYTSANNIYCADCENQTGKQILGLYFYSNAQQYIDISNMWLE